MQAKLDREGLAERIHLACNALLLQTNGRFNLLLRDSGLRLASGNFSVGRFDCRPDCSPRRQYSQDTRDQGLPVVET